MMAVMHLRHQIGDGELKLVRPKAARLALGRKPVTFAQLKENVGGLPDHKLARFQGRGRERRMFKASVLHEAH